MRTLLLLIAIAIFQSPLSFAQSNTPQDETSMSKHLIEVNQQWEGKTLNQKEICFENETQRIQFHLSQVLEYLSEADLSKLNNVQKENRKKTIQHLRQYQERALFPKNDVLPMRNPIFKDQHQTTCAVAHLLEQTGKQEVVNLIQQESNFAFIDKLSKDYPQINKWANEHGFRLEELALIQPGYPPAYRQFYPVGNGGPVEGKINVIKKNYYAEDLIVMAGEFSEIDGVEAQNIIAFDGENWVDLESPIVGEILDISFTNKLIVVGDFYLEDNPDMQNIAMWDDGVWVGLQNGDMEGTVKTVHVRNSQVFVGGDFKKINGEDISYLAKKNLIDLENSKWNNNQEFWLGGSPEIIENAFSVNGPVNVITNVEEKLLIAGLFDQTAPGVDSELITQYDVNNIAFWTSDWIVQMNQPFNEILEVAYIDNKLYLSDLVVDNNTIVPRVHILTAGFWTQNIFKCFDDTEIEDQRINGFIGYDDLAFVYGNIDVSDEYISMIYTSGFMGLANAGTQGIDFGGQVRAVESLGDKLYFAGDFSHPEGNGLVSADLITGGSNATHDLGLNTEVEIFTSEKVLQIEYENLQNEISFSLYNTSGQLIENFDLAKGSASIQRNLSGLTDGIYIYQLQDGNKMYSSKLSVF